MASTETIPEFLFDTFRGYKANTGIFVTWLGDTARKCGFTEHLITNTSSGNTSQKSKPKRVGKNTRPPPKTLIPRRQFPALAQAIAESDQEIPSYMFLVLKYLIQVSGKLIILTDLKQ